MDAYMQAQKRESRSVSLSREEWDWLESHATDGRISTAVRALIAMARNPRPSGEAVEGWTWGERVGRRDEGRSTER